MLGISAQYHDAAAALVVDGAVVAAVQEERLSRKKNDASLPFLAARACVALAGVRASDLDAVVFYEDPYRRLEHVLVHVLRTFPRSLGLFGKAMAAQLSSKLWVLDELSLGLGVARTKVEARSHHESHAASAFFVSPFEHAAVLVVDGVGEDITTSIWRGQGSSLTRLEAIAHPHSLGLLYAAITAWLGFTVLEGEQKVMGLAAFGSPTRVDDIERLIHIHGDGSFELALDYFAHHADSELGFSQKLEQLLGPRRPPARPWDLHGSDVDKHCADVAASLQLVLERALLALANRARARVPDADGLCLAGGVALNAVANAHLLREAGFSSVFVQPAAGDAGGALGAAILGALARGDARPPALTSAALGVPIVDDARPLATALGLRASTVDGDPAHFVAERLDRGGIVAVAQGRCEWGPRALGQRSLLALPAPVDVKHRINRAIKRREGFRPFAPALSLASAQERFSGVHEPMTSFMTTVCRANHAARAELPAVIHEDGTARVQTVAPASFLGRVVAELAVRGRAPCALNTSLNGRREPICASTGDVLAFLLAHDDVEGALIGDTWVHR
ncbi:MAG TPA: carbamoyltransferase N-terminal domain-containing protein [Myxococcota bacterium]